MIHSPHRPPISRRRESEAGNCFVWGCLSLFCFAVLVTIVIALVARYQISKIRDEYTAAQAVALPVTEMSESDLEDLLSRFDAFADGLRNGERPDPLKLDEEEINAIIQNHADYREIKEHIYVTINEDVVTGEVSIPLSFIPFFQDRYFNGTGTFDISLEDGDLWISLVGASVKGEPLPEYIMEQLRPENLAEDTKHDPDMQEFLNAIDTIEIKNDKLIIKPASD